jgi:indoleamine 2,3-dioxygenase
VNQILDEMTFTQPNGKDGLLAQNKLRTTVDAHLPDLMNEIKKIDKNDEIMNTALFRDYGFLSAAYMLEPCHLNYLKTKNYGKGTEYLPSNIAIPL